MVRAGGQGSVQVSHHGVAWEVLLTATWTNMATGTCRQTAPNSDTRGRHRPIAPNTDRWRGTQQLPRAGTHSSQDRVPGGCY